MADLKSFLALAATRSIYSEKYVEKERIKFTELISKGLISIWGSQPIKAEITLGKFAPQVLITLKSGGQIYEGLDSKLLDKVTPGKILDLDKLYYVIYSKPSAEDVMKITF